MIRFHSALADLMVPAATIAPDPRNANNGDTDAVVESILRNGVYRPVYASQATGQIVAGHNLYAALLELGAQMVPVMWLDGDDEQAIRILLADNRIAALARMDEPLLADLLARLVDTDAGLSGTGYTGDDVSDLLARIEEDSDTDLRLHLREHLTHTITCPECGHSWNRSG